MRVKFDQLSAEEFSADFAPRTTDVFGFGGETAVQLFAVLSRDEKFTEVESDRALLGGAELLDGGLDFGDGAHATESASCVPVGKAGAGRRRGGHLNLCSSLRGYMAGRMPALPVTESVEPKGRRAV